MYRWRIIGMASKNGIGFVAERFNVEMLATQARLLDIVQEGIVGINGARNAASDELSLVDVAKRMVYVRKIRQGYFSAELFHERAWDMLLDLFIASRTNRDTWVKSLLSAAEGSPTTAIRWLDHLEATGLIVRQADEEDRRRVIVNLTHKGEEAMTGYLQDVRSMM
jgi:predicted transcriptional regulator